MIIWKKGGTGEMKIFSLAPSIYCVTSVANNDNGGWQTKAVHKNQSSALSVGVKSCPQNEQNQKRSFCLF